jgi:uncharacterized protein (TIGR02611 family)
VTETARSQRPEQGGAPSRVAGRLSGFRARVRAVPGGWVAWRIGITLAGLVVIGVGVLLLPLPGPGWLIIFAGLGLLATEYEWASRLLRRTRGLVVGWTQWAARQSLPVRIGIGLLGLLVVAGAIAGSWYLYTVI